MMGSTGDVWRDYMMLTMHCAKAEGVRQMIKPGEYSFMGVAAGAGESRCAVLPRPLNAC